MKKGIFKKIVTLLLITMLVIPMSASVSASNEYEEMMHKQATQLLTFNEIYDFMEESDLLVNYFAGAYFTEDGELIICVANIREQEITKLVENESIKFEKVSFKEVEYTYQDLVSNFNLLVSNAQSIDIEAISIDEEKNRIIVTPSSSKEKSMEYINKIVSTSEMIAMLEVGKLYSLEYTTDVTLGTRYKDSAYSSLLGTFGFSVKDSQGNKGWLIPGHTSIPCGGSVYYGTTNIGQVVVKSCGGNVDSAFVKCTNTSYDCVWDTPSETYYSWVQSTYGYPVNTAIFMHGGVSGKKYGVILENYCSAPNDSGTWMIYVRTSYASQIGDSGSPVGINSIIYPSDPNKRVLIGLHSAILTDQQTGQTYGAFTRIQDNFNAFAVTPYKD